MKNVLSITVGVIAAIACSATADITIAHGSSAGTYATTLNFDEAGGPTGFVTTDAFASYGITSLQAGDGVPQVGDFDTPNGGWGLGTGNSFFGNFGVFINFDSDLTEFSTQVWDPSGPPSLFGGGLGVFVFNDGVEIANNFDITPAWGGVGDTWLDITTSGGMVFDEVRILGFGFDPRTYVDNMSWNAVPAPGSFGLLGLGLLGIRRRR
jgi:PEP-CTERM motif-containing protein